ncbi:unnamed protein product [Paramecium sonneborni]|uniref:Uncharacterized protein n=1 Tax=Paramecium sonneborni TaxID=65129 RepID=A0A8S1RRK5_9CILI|nr:unnamed protein product [Paramecium sonneborni]
MINLLCRLQQRKFIQNLRNEDEALLDYNKALVANKSNSYYNRRNLFENLLMNNRHSQNIKSL